MPRKRKGANLHRKDGIIRKEPISAIGLKDSSKGQKIAWNMQWSEDSMEHAMVRRQHGTCNGQKIAWSKQLSEDSMEHAMVRR